MSSYSFSRRTVLAAIEVLEQLTQAQFFRFLFDLGPQFPQWVAAENMSLTKRLNSLMALLDQRPDMPTVNGELVQDKVVEKAVSFMPNLQYLSEWEKPHLNPAQAALAHDLELDGFTIMESAVRRTLPQAIKLPETESELVELLKKHRFVTAHDHLENALSAHTRGEWAGANGQLRTFIDALLDEIAIRLDPADASLKSGLERRSKLANLGFLSRDLNEWDDKGLGFLNGLIKRLHPQGAHPGLSDDADSTFRLHTVLLTAHLLVVRFDTLVQTQP